MKSLVRYNFKQGGWFESVLTPIPFIILYWFQGKQIILTIAIYLFSVWLFRLFSFRYLRVTKQHIIGIKFLKPLKRFYRYKLSDLKEVKLLYHNKGGWKAYFKFADGIRFCGEIIYDKKILCSFFLDNNISVYSNNSDLKHFIFHYHLDPEINRKRQAELRKARELARQKRLNTLYTKRMS